MKQRTSKKGNKYAYVQFSDTSANFEAIIFSDILNESYELIKNQDLLLLTLEITKNENNVNSRVIEMISLKQFINESNKNIKIIANDGVDLSNLKNQLNNLKSEFGSEITLIVNLEGKMINISIPGKYDFFNIINNKSDDISVLN